MISNTETGFGAVARALHWLTALLILSALALGLYGESLPRGTGDEVARVAALYSVHKTIGITAFFVALARILWALTQHRPAPLHPARRAETFLAETVHWALYGAMVVMPLSGWIHHAALDGFAPILWPFGQDLPFVPKSDAVAHVSGAVHGLSAWVIYVTVGLHVLGALKHAVVDRDGTIARMTTGRGPAVGFGGAHLAPAAAAVVIWGGVIGTALATAAAPDAAPAAPAATASASAGAHPWTVTEGTLSISLVQMGSAVTGSFTGWSAAIDYDEAARSGHVEVAIPLSGLKLGSVTDQALGAEFFDAANHPSAQFAADIAPGEGTGLVATGTLSLRGADMPVTLPFTLAIEGDTARMQGEAVIDRRDWGIGPTYKDEATVGFPVTVTVDLTATRG
ncbi:cytochrome b/b6 domain-containing protein [Frigidibacter sp. MR17.24]|uniref:cytochrome b/b6 domain-containing protein n=1 Tax=Frigidibacter sp. MR17.24 TaxID=3127345 RepID=UPI003012AAA7